MKHTLVLDIGKTHAKLVLIDSGGEVLAQQVHANRSENGPGYLALGTAAIETWLLQAITRLPQRQRVGSVIVTTHGAAFCAIDATGLVLPPIDYEWDGYGEHRQAFVQLVGGPEVTGSPHLPLGLNAGLQLYWLHQTQATAWQRIQHWLPYPQYWAWWFSGVAASEVSSLGCHTHLWQPARHTYAPWVHATGIAGLFAPMRPAWEVLGPVRPELASRTGLPSDCAVHVGVHDSNACLTRHLRAAPGSTVVSTGTWCVVMAPGAQGGTPNASQDQLINVSVEGQPVPTSRFMGGREFAALCAGSDPSLATEAALREAMAQGWQVVCPAASGPDGSTGGQPGRVLLHGTEVANGVAAVPIHLRPALASQYCADVTAQLVRAMDGTGRAHAPVVVEGPLAKNPAFTARLTTCLPGRQLLLSTDPLEGTARGAWMLADWPARAQRMGWYEPAPLAAAVEVSSAPC